MEILGGPGRLSRTSLTELYAFREVLGAFVARQVKVKYKQAAVGIGWAVIQPVASAALFTIFFGRLVHVASEGAPYLLFALAGMVIWTYFAGAVGGAMESLIADQGLLRKVYFPREILPLSHILASLVDLAPAFLLVGGVAAAYGRWPDVTWFALPIPILLVVLAASALGVGLSCLNVYYRDVRYVLPFVLQLGLLATPIAYSLSLVPGQWRTLFVVVNPVGEAIDSFRRIVIHHTWPDWPVALGVTAWTLVLFGLAFALFKRLERGFADRV
jgi:lipopolysaccharide transport system permease protein